MLLLSTVEKKQAVSAHPMLDPPRTDIFHLHSSPGDC